MAQLIEALVTSGKDYAAPPLTTEHYFTVSGESHAIHMSRTDIIGAIAFYTDTAAGNVVALVMQIFDIVIVALIVHHIPNLCA